MQKRAQEHMWLLVGYEVLLGVSQLMNISFNSILIMYHYTYKDTASSFINLSVFYKEILIDQISMI